MSQSEEALLREEAISLYNTLSLTLDVIEAAERHLGHQIGILKMSLNGQREL